jgi:hypothetical protein
MALSRRCWKSHARDNARVRLTHVTRSARDVCNGMGCVTAQQFSRRRSALGPRTDGDTAAGGVEFPPCRAATNGVGIGIPRTTSSFLGVAPTCDSRSSQPESTQGAAFAKADVSARLHRDFCTCVDEPRIPRPPLISRRIDSGKLTKLRSRSRLERTMGRLHRPRHESR